MLLTEKVSAPTGAWMHIYVCVYTHENTYILVARPGGHAYSPSTWETEVEG